MAGAVVYSKTGVKKEAPVKLSPKVFGAEANHELVATAYRAYLANGRQMAAQTLTRGEVRGGGRKPHKQKGTGRARAGGTRLPHWRGGGKAFGPTGEENHRVNLSVKAKRSAIRQALSLQAQDKKIIILENYDGGEGKVKPTVALLDKLELEGSILLVVPQKTATIDQATRNIAGLHVVSAKFLNVYAILTADWIVIAGEAQQIVTEWLEAGV